MDFKKFKEKIISNKNNLLDIIFILVIGLLSLTWFKGDLLIYYSDFSFPINRAQYFSDALNVWVPDSTGWFNIVQGNLFFGFFSYITELLNIPLLTYEKIMFYIWFTSAGISMYILASVIKTNRIARITASLIYMMNPFSLIIIWAIGQGMLQKGYAFFPLIIALYIYGIKNGKNFPYVLLAALIMLITSFLGVETTLQLTSMYWVTISIIFLVYILKFFFFKEKHKLIHAVIFTTYFFLIWLLFNFYVIAGLLMYMNTFVGEFSFYQAKVFAPNLEIFRQNSAKILDSIRLLGYWPFGPNWGDIGGIYYPYSGIYFTPLFIFISFLYPLFVVFSFLKKKIKLEQIIFGIILLVGIFLAKGSFEPFGKFSEYLFINISILQGFRNPYPPAMMVVTLSISILTAICVQIIYENFQKHVSCKFNRLNLLIRTLQIPTIIIILILLVGVFVFPFWTGDIGRPLGEYSHTSSRIQIPDYYYQFSEWDSEQSGDYRLMVLPLSYGYNYIYRWEYGFTGPNILTQFTNKEIVNKQNLLPLYDLLVDLQSGIKVPDGSSFSKLAGLMSVKYVVFNNDTEWEVISNPNSGTNPYKGANINTINEVIRDSGLEYIEKMGELFIYKNKNFTPRIFTTNNYIFVDDINSFPSVVSLPDFKPTTVVILKNGYGGDRTFIEELNKKNINFYFDTTHGITNENTTFFIENNGFYQNFVGTQVMSIDLDEENLYRGKLKENLLNLTGQTSIMGTGVQNAKDSFTINNNSIKWYIDRKYKGERFIKLPLNRPTDFSDGKLLIRVYGSNTSNLLNFQIYSKNESTYGWRAWHLKDDWKGWRVLEFSFNKFDAASDQNTTSFNVQELVQLSVYYYNNIESVNENTTVDISFVTKLSKLEGDSWGELSPVYLNKGSHNIRVISPENSRGIYLRSVATEIEPPIISYKNISPSEYRINVQNASEPFLLIFSECYNPEWSAYFGNLQYPMVQQFAGKLIDTHFMANGFANGWYINKTGSFDITLYFKPQSVYSFSLIISIVSILASIAFLVFYIKRSK